MKKNEKIGIIVLVIFFLIMSMVVVLALNYEENRELPDGYKLITNGKIYSIIDDSGWRVAVDFSSKRRAVNFAWRWYEYENSEWKEVK